MPELPEVETVVRELKRASLVNQEILNVQVYWPKMIQPKLEKEFYQTLTGKWITDFSRRGKYILMSLSSGNYLLLHLRMTGKVRLEMSGTAKQKHDHLIISFQNGAQLHYNDTRKFGRFIITDNLEFFFRKLGPEPLSEEFDLSLFKEALEKRKRRIKPLLLEQTVVAGLGNIYVDEALFQAGIHPESMSPKIPVDKAKLLHQAIKDVLMKGIENGGTSLGDGLGNYKNISREKGRNQDFLKVFHKTGQPCPSCGKLIGRIIVGQRSSHICTDCQKKY